jgi:hypothetical protein
MGRKDMHKRIRVGMILVCVIVAGLLATPAGAVQAVANPTPSYSATLEVRPTSGPAGTSLMVKGTGFFPRGGITGGCMIWISFTDATGVKTLVKTLSPAASFKTRVFIPHAAATGPGTVDAFQVLGDIIHCHVIAQVDPTATFTVTGQGRWLL